MDWCRQENTFCKTCIGNDCNNQQSLHTCYSCNSKNISSNCYSPSDETKIETCPYYTDKCFIHIENNEITRGCLSNLNEDKCKNENICETCTESGNCNGRTIGREHCYSCNSTSNSDCDQMPNEELSIPCSDEITLHEEGCYRKEIGK